MSRGLKDLGDFIGRRPRIAVAIVVLITLLSVLSVAINGIETEFTMDDFMPDNEVAEASVEIQSTFTTSYGVTLLVRSQHADSPDILTREAFKRVLEAEQSVLDEDNITQYLVTPDSPLDSLISPVRILMTVVYHSIKMTQPDLLESIGASGGPTTDNLIKLLGIIPTDGDLKSAIRGMLQAPGTPEYIKANVPRLLSDDFDPNSSWPTAAGGLLMFNFNKELVGENKQIAPLELETAIEARIAAADSDDPSIFVMGISIIADEITRAAGDSVKILFPIALCAIVIILFLVYRDIADVLLGLAALLIAVIWVYGFGTAFGYSFNPMTTVVPILVLGLGIDYSIHLVLRYREERSDGKGIEEGARNTIMSVGETLLLATITTSIAFLSNLNSPLEAIGDFGVLCAVGIISSFVVMILLVPAVRAMRDRRREARNQERVDVRKTRSRDGRLSKITGIGGRAALRRPRTVVIVALVVTGGFGYGALNLDSTFDLYDFLPEDLEISQNLDFMVENFTGLGEERAKVLVKGDATDPDLVRAIEDSVANMAGDEHVLMMNGVPDVSSYLYLMYDYATNTSGVGYQDPRYDPEFEAMYHQYFEVTDLGPMIGNTTTSDNITLLLGWMQENAPGDLMQVLSMEGDQFSILLSVGIVGNLGSDEIWEVYNDLDSYVEPIRAQGASATVTGDIILVEVINRGLNESQMTSLLTTLIASLIILTLVLWISSRSWVLGCMAMLPILFCVIWMWGTMFLMDIPLNVMTLTIAALTVGIGVTYGIHITHRFVEELGRGGIEEAVRRSTGSTGVALMGAAVTTVIGFGILGFSILPPVQQFGVITATAIAYSFISAVFVLPAILVIWARRKGAEE